MGRPALEGISGADAPLGVQAGDVIGKYTLRSRSGKADSDPYTGRGRNNRSAGMWP